MKTRWVKKFNVPIKPLTLKIVISPNLTITSSYPALHNFGITVNTFEGFSKLVGENFAYNEFFFMMKGILIIEEKICVLEENNKSAEIIKNIIDFINDKIGKKIKAADKDKLLEFVKDILPSAFCEDAYEQLDYTLSRISTLLDLDEMNEDDTSVGVQAMVYGNTGDSSFAGSFFTRNVITGEKKISGEYFQNTFDFTGSKGKDINKIEKNYLAKLDKIARTIEDTYKTIRHIRFTIENKNTLDG